MSDRGDAVDPTFNVRDRATCAYETASWLGSVQEVRGGQGVIASSASAPLTCKVLETNPRGAPEKSATHHHLAPPRSQDKRAIRMISP